MMINRRVPTTLLPRCLVAACAIGIAPAALANPLQVQNPGPLPTALVGSPYLQSLQAEGGTSPYSWSGQVPASLDLALSTNGVLSGTPTQGTNGPVQFSVTVTDSVGTTASATLSLTVVVPNLLTIVPSDLPMATVGTAYETSIPATDSNVPNATFAWSVSGLPPGLQFTQVGDPAVAQVSGKPLLGGGYPVQVQVTDNVGNSTSHIYQFFVDGNPTRLTPQTLPAALIGERYSAQLQVMFVMDPIWTVVSGALPPGLSLSSSGAITGTVPSGTTPASYPFNAAATDASASGPVVLSILAIEVQAAPPGGGCATGAGSMGVGLVLIGMGWMARGRGKRRAKSCPCETD